MNEWMSKIKCDVVGIQCDNKCTSKYMSIKNKTMSKHTISMAK